MTPIYDCIGCGTGITDFQNHFPSHHSNLENYRFNTLVENIFMNLKRLRVLSILLRLKDLPISVLDWGCGRGEVLATFRKFGSSVTGLEYDKKTAKEARERNMSVYISREGGVEALKNSAKRYSVVTAFHFLEHVENPKEVLVDISNLLTTGGILIAEVPNYASFQKIVTGKFWMGYDTKNHFYHFTPTSFEKMLNETGFEVFSKTYFSLEYGLPMFFFSLIDKTTKKTDYFFGILKKSSNIDMNRKMNSLNRILSFSIIVISLFIAPTLFIIEFFSCLKKRGGVIRYYAKQMDN
jgi:2-polyprenyl-3-methyl-5-hydroxy-6-metoxy-1,4-benzoquinol methylase